MSSTRVLRSNRKQRLDILEEWLDSGIMIQWKDAPKVLCEAGIVSTNYGLKNLASDIWYLRREYFAPSIKALEEVEFGTNKILFHIVIRCLLDIKSGRPCDLDQWSNDMSPDFCACSRNNYLCAEDAESFLLDMLHDNLEPSCNLPPGKIRSIIKEIKKDPIFSIGSLLASDVPTSFVALRILGPRSQGCTEF